MDVVDRLLEPGAQDLSEQSMRHLMHLAPVDRAWLELVVVDEVEAWQDARQCIQCGTELPEPEGAGRPSIRCSECRQARPPCSECGGSMVGEGWHLARCKTCRKNAQRLKGERPMRVPVHEGADLRAGVELPKLPWQE